MKEPILKRPFDFVISLVGIIIALPYGFLIALIIWLEDGVPVFYLQERVGFHGRTFKLRKFRSMIKNAERQTGPIWAQENDPRITKTGRILRATGHDEIPQLINILFGDMSFVGPRPERPEFVTVFEKKIPNYNLRHLVKPGITGIAQVFSKYNPTPQCKLKYDLLYVKQMSFCLDLKLIALTFWLSLRVILKGKWENGQKKNNSASIEIYKQKLLGFQENEMIFN